MTHRFLGFPHKLFFMTLPETFPSYSQSPSDPPRESVFHGILSKMSLLTFRPNTYYYSSMFLRSCLLDGAFSPQSAPPILIKMWMTGAYYSFRIWGDDFPCHQPSLQLMLPYLSLKWCSWLLNSHHAVNHAVVTIISRYQHQCFKVSSLLIFYVWLRICNVLISTQKPTSMSR